MAQSFVCKVIRGSCPFWSNQQLGGFLASARKTLVESNAAEGRTRSSAETLVFWLRMRRCGGSSPVLSTSVGQCHFVACRATDTGHGMGVWPAAKISNGRLCARCVMSCWPARWRVLRRLMVRSWQGNTAVVSELALHCPNVALSKTLQCPNFFKKKTSSFGHLKLLLSI